MRVAIIDYGSGNLRSAAKAFERASAMRTIDTEIVVTSRAEQVAGADRVVLPGVGAFADCKAGLEALDGMTEALGEAVRINARPFLGICVGMQLMAAQGHEHGRHAGFSWIEGEVCPIAPSDPALKVPHMGWNTLDLRKPHPLLAGCNTGPRGQHAYFVHSYHLIPENADDLLVSTDYAQALTAMVVRDNMAGTQFHPEKSQALGLALIGNFLTWTP